MDVTPIRLDSGGGLGTSAAIHLRGRGARVARLAEKFRGEVARVIRPNAVNT